MTQYGVTSTGFVVKPLDVIKEEKETLFRNTFGDSIDLAEDGPFGQIIGILSGQEADVWLLAQSTYSAFDPDQAEGTALDGLCALTGTIREPAAYSTVVATCTGTPGTVLNIGRQASVETAGTKFETTASATITAVNGWGNGAPYVIGDRVFNASRSYVCITAGTSAGSGGPTTTASDITDGTVHWKYLGEGTGAVDVTMQATETGALVANAGTLTVIETPVSGWSSVTNLEDEDTGRAEETDSALRIRRETELRRVGGAAVEAIRTDVLDVDEVTACTVFENVSDVTDGDGVPPHAIEVLVSGGEDDEIATAIFDSKSAGIGTYGDTSVGVVDSQGITHTISFSRPDEIDIYVQINLVVDAEKYPSGSDAIVKQAVVDYGDATYYAGKNVVASALEAVCFSAAPGILEAEVLIKTSATPTARTTIAIGTRQIADLDTSRTGITSTPGTP